MQFIKLNRTKYCRYSKGTVILDSHRSISFIIFRPDNLPVTVYMTSGHTLYYENDVFGRRTSTSDPSGDYNGYYYGAGERAEVVCLYYLSIAFVENTK